VLDLADQRAEVAGHRLDGPEELAGLARIADALRGELARDLAPLLSRTEIAATRRRVDSLVAAGSFPYPRPDWPAIPWPPF
jgi:hypothetical protein